MINKRRDRFEAFACRGLQILLIVAVIFLVWLFCIPAQAGDWITAPSFYTHRDGERVTQHTPIGPFYYQPKQDQGGWTRSVLRGPDGSVDVYWSGTYRGVVSPYLDFGNTSRVRMPWDDPGPVNNPWEYRRGRRGIHYRPRSDPYWSPDRARIPRRNTPIPQRQRHSGRASGHQGQDRAHTWRFEE